MAMALSHEELIAVAHAHSAAEADADLEATLATLDDDPIYELQPVGLTFGGKDAVRAYYEYFFESFMPRTVGSSRRGEWIGDDAVAEEYGIDVRMPDGDVEHHPIIGILVFGQNGLAGERVWASDRLLRVLFGPAYDLAIPIAAER
jgi:hypothetical protein